jgi:hypothetical protein
MNLFLGLLNILLLLSFYCPQNVLSQNNNGNLQSLPNPQVDTDEEKVSNLLLQGGIEHSINLQPLSSEFCSGSQIDPKALKTQSGKGSGTSLSSGLSKTEHSPDIDAWFKLPKPFIGVFEVSKETRVYLADYKTTEETSKALNFSAKRSEHWGYQKDNDANVWMCLPVPYSNVIDRNQTAEIQTISVAQPLYIEPDHMVFLFRRRSLFVDLRSNKIIEAGQVESIEAYTPLASGDLKVTASIKRFDQSGSALRLTKTERILKKQSGFVQQNSLNGKDLKTSFAKFLNSKHKPEPQFVP